MAKQNRMSRTDKSGIVAMEVERTFENGSAFRHGALMSEIDLANMSDDEIFHMLGSGREESTLLPFRLENVLCRREIPGVTVIPRPIEPLDHWNSSFYKVGMAMHADKSRLTDIHLSSNSYKEAISFLEEYNEYTINAWKLRDSQPDLVPVSVEKLAGSNIPGLEMTKYHVRHDVPLKKFVNYIRNCVRIIAGQPMFVYFNNSEPHRGALMSEIDDANKGEDGFLHMTYSGGEEKGIVEYDAQICDLILGKVVKKKERKIKGDFILSKGIVMLDTWNDHVNKKHMAQLEEKAALKGKSAAESSTFIGEHLWELCQEREINPWLLRKKKPDHIPVNVKKDPSSKIPDICMKKFQVHFDLPLSEFIEFIRIRIEWKEGWKWTKPLFLYFKNTDPPAGTSMYVIDKENKDDDGFLNITYSGEEKGAWTQLKNEEFAQKVKI
ncbi:hypothetical protein D8674_021242 [Pyrus ussuriensis x Pyrus communis]|uniref:Autophagy-related protein n=1 Tax=Pyrus ussuriensis x Pyrus communis TaxID=2448454 RepID=A0A5N5GV81_9ROSA|nr:hypothetical protein D8674_021242 [Pyrus ussuriensis x Pyrus communis]